MRELFERLIELQSITTDKEIESFIYKNKNNRELMLTIGFIINKLDITNIDTKKWDKSYIPHSIIFHSMSELIKFVREKCTGKNSDIEYLKGVSTTLEKDEREIFKQIFTKNFKLGIGSKIFNPLVSDEYKLPQQIYNGCVPFNQKRIEKMFKENDYLIEDLKEDGLFSNVVLNNGAIELTSRSLHSLKFPNYTFTDELIQLSKGKHVVLNGEITIPSISDRLVSNGIVSRISKYSMEYDNKKLIKIEKDFMDDFGVDIESFRDKLVYTIWDIVPYSSYINAYDSTPLVDRRINLVNLLDEAKLNNVKLIQTRNVYSYLDLMKSFSKVLSNKFEGLVVKTPNAEYVNKKNINQVKMKLEFDIDLEICGFEEGSGRLVGTLGNLIVKSSCGKLENGTSGFTDTIRKEIFENKDKYLGKIVSCKCRGTSKNNNGGLGLLYNTFVSIRDDKQVADSWEDILRIQESILQLEKGVI